METPKDTNEAGVARETKSKVGLLLTRLVLAWRRLLCRHGRHVTICRETGLKNLPWLVGECIHCGVIQHGVSTPYGSVIIGERPSFDAFIRSQNAELRNPQTK